MKNERNRSGFQRLAIGYFQLLLLASAAFAQSITSGSITGVVTDPAGANIPSASVTATETSTNSVHTAESGAKGDYRFSLLPPGTYRVEARVTGFQAKVVEGVVVTPGQPTAVDFQLAVASQTQTVEVTESASVLQTENADNTTSFSSKMIDTLPNPGGDLSYIAQTAPGVVMNTQAGYGNFSSEGMPGTSNLFTINGQNYNDPFLGLNNSGASNLLLGANDIAEANVITNAYSAQYGQYAGAQVTYTTKYGTNAFHANADYFWNGRALNANQFFANQSGLPTPFNNFNQWAVGAQGPIWKNKTFFDVDYEGLRNLLPSNALLNLVPSPQFQAATLANLANVGQSAELPFYNKLFALYNGAPGTSGAVAAPSSTDPNTGITYGGGCGLFQPAGLSLTTPCALQFRSTPPNLNHEYQWSTRVDHNFSDKDRVYVRVLRDNGFQPTYTSPFGATFNADSVQPQMDGQVSETHSFGPNTINQFNGSALFYQAVFVPSNGSAALSALPTFMTFSDGSLASVGAYGEPGGFFFPNGRRVFQYQILDDFSHIHGQHTFRAGFSWLHDTVTDLDFESIGGPIYGNVTTNLTDFFNGGGSSTTLTQAFPSTPEASLRFNTYGGYIADDWKITANLNVSLNLRFESYASPTCDTKCFSRLQGDFLGQPVANSASIPYNQLILSGQKDAYPGTSPLVYEPRVGIAWKPSNSDKTVIRAGAGVFADELPGGAAEFAAFNPPNLSAFNISGLPFAPGVPNSLFSTASSANQALASAFASGGSFSTISASVPGFNAPSFTNFPSHFKQPTYYKWNFEIEQALTNRLLLSINYSGMHGEHIPVADNGVNAYCPTTLCPNYFGLPTVAPNQGLGEVTQYLSAGDASYDGLIISLQRRLSTALTFNINYTWSHALDDVSNGGISNEPFGILATNTSITVPQNPFNIRGNYGSADYDIRHYFSANFVYSDLLRHSGFHWGPNKIFGGWTLSSNWFLRSGLPFSATDGAAGSALLGDNYGGTIFATPTTSLPQTCGNGGVNAACFTTSQFVQSYGAAFAAQQSGGATATINGWGTAGRNTLRGPGFFDVDAALTKEVAFSERVHFVFGAQAYNLFNHANFDQPVGNIDNPNFGSIIANVGPPTSLLGSFVGAGSSPRFIEIKGVLRF